MSHADNMPVAHFPCALRQVMFMGAAQVGFANLFIRDRPLPSESVPALFSAHRFHRHRLARSRRDDARGKPGRWSSSWVGVHTVGYCILPRIRFTKDQLRWRPCDSSPHSAGPAKSPALNTLTNWGDIFWRRPAIPSSHRRRPAGRRLVRVCAEASSFRLAESASVRRDRGHDETE